MSVPDEKALLTSFESLCGRASACRICPQLADRLAVLSPLNGSLDPTVFFIAEAPGRMGADRTRRPFFGDKSGDNFQHLLDSIGLDRDDIFITNSVMCSPRTPTGANRRPTSAEIHNCGDLLAELIGLIQPRIIATLGSVALGALKNICVHDLTLKEHAGAAIDWNGRILVPLYHPSPQVVAFQRGLGTQLQHFQTLARFTKSPRA